MPILLDHTIVGQQLTSLTIRKDREFAACRICGAVFQSRLATDVDDMIYDGDPMIPAAVTIETREWRDAHNKTHSPKVHQQFNATGRTFTPEAAHKLAPFGLVSLDMDDDEVAHAMLVAPRAPYDDVETTMKGWV